MLTYICSIAAVVLMALFGALQLGQMLGDKKISLASKIALGLLVASLLTNLIIFTQLYFSK